MATSNGKSDEGIYGDDNRNIASANSRTLLLFAEAAGTAVHHIIYFGQHISLREIGEAIKTKKRFESNALFVLGSTENSTQLNAS